MPAIEADGSALAAALATLGLAAWAASVALGTGTLYSSLHPDTVTAEIDHLLSAQSVPMTRHVRV